MRSRAVPPTFRSLLVVALTVFSGGCTFLAEESTPPQPAFEVEIETVEAQALRAVEESAVEFTVPLREADEAAARGRLFFREYTGTEPTSTAESPRSVILSSPVEPLAGYRYTVRQSRSPEGYRFKVECLPVAPAGTTELAERNARNVARFIREGTLELSLLAR
ncbi:MAG: hypothetical protein RL417_1428 [Pseudomonadota bacterium]